MARWEKTEYNLKPNHGWRCSPGHKLIVLGRGMAQFEYPNTWIVVPGETSFKLHDRTPPDDDMVLEISVLPLPGAADDEIPIAYMLQESLLVNTQNFIEEKDIKTSERWDLRLVWAEYRRIEDDPKDGKKREAVWRHCFCYHGKIYAVLTFGFWSDHYAHADRVWKHFLDTIQLDQEIADPTQGPLLN